MNDGPSAPDLTAQEFQEIVHTACDQDRSVEGLQQRLRAIDLAIQHPDVASQNISEIIEILLQEVDFDYTDTEHITQKVTYSYRIQRNCVQYITEILGLNGALSDYLLQALVYTLAKSNDPETREKAAEAFDELEDSEEIDLETYAFEITDELAETLSQLLTEGSNETVRESVVDILAHGTFESETAVEVSIQALFDAFGGDSIGVQFGIPKSLGAIVNSHPQHFQRVIEEIVAEIRDNPENTKSFDPVMLSDGNEPVDILEQIDPEEVTLPDDCVQQFARLITHDNSRTQKLAIRGCEILAKQFYGSVDSIADPLIDLLDEEDNEEVREAAASALSIIYATGDVDPHYEIAKKFVQDENSDVRKAGVWTTGTLIAKHESRNTDAYQLLFSAVADEHSDVREAALILMQKIWEVDPQVREKMTDEAISIVSAESEHSDVKTEALSLLRKAITQSPQRREEILPLVVGSLADIGVRDQVQELLVSLYNDVPEIRDALRDEVQRLVHTSDEWRTRQAGQDLLNKFVRDDEELTKQAEVFEALSDLPGESIANEETGTEHSDRDGEFTVDPDENPEEIATSLINDFKTNPTEWFTLLEDDDPTVRISACEFLAIVARSLPDRRETVVCKLYPLLADEDWRVRSSAITALTTVGREDPTLRGDVFIRIVDAFEDGDMGVRVAVLQALNQLVPETTDTSQRVSEILLAAVDDEEDRVRLQAVALLPTIAEHTSVSNELIAHCLIRAFQDESLTVRSRGKTVLREIAEIRVDELDDLIGELSERFDQPDLRAELVFAVAGVVDDHPSVADTAIRGFRVLLKNTDIKPHTRAMSISTLSDLSELSDVPAQLPAEGILIGMKDESPDVREQAFQSLPVVADTAPELLASKVEILIDVLEREYAAVTADIQLDDSVDDLNEFPNNSSGRWTFSKDISAEESSSFTISTDPLSAETQTAAIDALVTTYWSDESLQITADQRSVLEGIITGHSSTPKAQTLLIDMLAHLHSRNETFSESGARL